MPSAALALARDEHGQTTVEYILLLAFVILVSAGMFQTLNRAVDEGTLTFGAALEKDLNTGRMPTSAWTEDQQ